MRNLLHPKRTALAHALALAFLACMPYAVQAQSNTTGTIFGSVDAQSGSTILIEGQGTGFRRTVTPDAAGKFQALSLPVGEYKVSLIRNGKVERTEDVSVTIGAGKEVSFSPARVEVTGRVTRIDVQNTNLGATFTAKELARIPVANNLGAVIRLAPNTVRGDRLYGGDNAPTFGGASASENAFFMNGYPVTNPLTQVGFTNLPFGSIAQTQVLSGGYGAEFGRSTGGVVNVTTKSGTNTWEAGVAFQWEPNALRARPRNTVYPANGTPQDNQVRQYYEGDRRNAYLASVYAGGPLVQDKLFVFANAEYQLTQSETTRLASNSGSAARAGWEERSLQLPRFLAKFDWNVTDDYHLEYTLLRDRPKDKRDYYGFNYATRSRNDVYFGGAEYESYGPTPVAALNGGDVDILKLTAHVTDDLTLTGLVGRTKTERSQKLINYDPTLPRIINSGIPTNFSIPATSQAFTDAILAPGAYNKTNGYRLDLEYRLNNDHTLRAGIDSAKLKNYGGVRANGPGYLWNYESDDCGAAISAPGAPVNDALPSADGKTCYHVFRQATKWFNQANVDQAAEYVEDRWQMTKNFLLVLGLRNESFKNYNGDGQVFARQDRQIEPRIQASWDVYGDSSTKIYGSVGRYHLQLPANVAIRTASPSTYLQQYFNYTGIDPRTGEPTGLTAISPVFSPDGETGGPKDIGYVAATDLKSHYQDDFAVGFEKALTKGLNVGAKLTYRELKNTLEDWCDTRPFLAWARRNKVGTDKFEGKGAFNLAGPAFSCAIINPGQTNTFDLDIDGDGRNEHVVLTPEDMGGGESSRDTGSALQKASRTYFALDLFAEHPFDGSWYGKVNYTWSKSRGNTEGQLNSDTGQADVATTAIYDFKEIMEFAYGRLPNDRTHAIKAFGFVNLTPEWSVGVNFQAISGRPISCMSNYGIVDKDNFAGQSYSSAPFHYCSANPQNPGAGVGLPSPRGSRGELPWDTSLDLNVAYKPAWFNGLMFKVDVFNALNSQTANSVVEQTNTRNIYNMVNSWTSPRSVKFTVQYDRKF